MYRAETAKSEAARLQERMRQLRQEQRVATAQFVATELDLAITFCQIALSSTNRSKVLRNVENATRARDSALHFLEKSAVLESDIASPGTARRIRRKLTQLEALLRKL